MTTRINNVTVLGTGVLGSQIAYQTAYSGFEVTAYDISVEIVEAARKRFEELAARYEREVEGARGGRAQAALASIKYSSSLDDAVRDADLVIESAPERMDIKRELNVDGVDIHFIHVRSKHPGALPLTRSTGAATSPRGSSRSSSPSNCAPLSDHSGRRAD